MKIRLLIAAAIAVTFVVAGCDSSSDDTASAPVEATTTTLEPTTTTLEPAPTTTTVDAAMAAMPRRCEIDDESGASQRPASAEDIVERLWVVPQLVCRDVEVSPIGDGE